LELRLGRRRERAEGSARVAPATSEELRRAPSALERHSDARGGDEFLNTQRGNNNPYNQDNEITWLDWARLEQFRDVFRFFKHDRVSQGASVHRSPHFLARRREVVWSRWAGGPGSESRCVAYALRGASVGDDDLYVMINGHWEDRSFKVQEGQPSEWRRVVDTAEPSPNDILEPGKESKLESASYTVRSRSVVVLRRQRK
jgi:glycogen operon protein